MTINVAKRIDYTFKYNAKLGRHGWLRLTPAYSVKLVKELVAETPQSGLVLDPFSGTATTGLCAAELGMNVYLCDINPFLIWFGRAKCFHFEKSKISELKKRVERVVKAVPDYLSRDLWTPDIFNIERWWCGHTLPIVAALRQAIVDEFDEPGDDPYANLVWITFCRVIIETSSAAFNHVSMSFKGGVTTYEINQVEYIFCTVFDYICESTAEELSGSAQLLLEDSRNISLPDEIRFDHVVTSPPYPNRMSYIRELRPYMYWTKFLQTAPEAGELDWKAIGGTWGIATSRLNEWTSDNVDLPSLLLDTCQKILNSGDKNSGLMARYVHKYFYDMYLHFAALRRLLSDGARLDYIVGNSTFYGIHVHTEKIYETTLLALGFSETKSRIIRRRNSKKELYEYCVSARWNS